MKCLPINFRAISGNSKHFSFSPKNPKKSTDRGQGGPPNFVLPQILIFLWLKTPLKISEPYDN